MPKEPRRNQNLPREGEHLHLTQVPEHSAHFFGFLEDDLHSFEVNLEVILLLFLQLIAIFLKCFGNIREGNEKKTTKAHTELTFTKTSDMGFQEAVKIKPSIEFSYRNYKGILKQDTKSRCH